MTNASAINLSTLPATQRATVEALMQEASALKEVEAEKETRRAASQRERTRRKTAPRRNIGNLPASLPRISPGQRLSARQTRTAPMVAAFGEWLQIQRRKISAKSRLGERIA